jgi:hypothetical protein
MSRCVDGLVAELGAHSVLAQANSAVVRGPLPPPDQPCGDVAGVGSDRRGGGRTERYGVGARIGTQERITPHSAVPVLRLLEDVLGFMHQAAASSSRRASWIVIE